MEKTLHEAQLIVVNIIRDVLVDLATDGGTSEEDIEEMNDHFGRVAEFVIEQLGLEVVESEGGKVMASLNPVKGWV